MKYIARWTVAHEAIIDAKDDDEALEKFAASEYTDETEEMTEYEVEEVDFCDICKRPMTWQGYCGCTNKQDARDAGFVAPGE